MLASVKRVRVLDCEVGFKWNPAQLIWICNLNDLVCDMNFASLFSVFIRRSLDRILGFCNLPVNDGAWISDSYRILQYLLINLIQNGCKRNIFGLHKDSLHRIRPVMLNSYDNANEDDNFRLKNIPPNVVPERPIICAIFISLPLL